MPRLDRPDNPVGVARYTEHVSQRHEQDREEDVDAGPGKDDSDALRGPLAPVGVEAERVSQLVHRTARRLRRAGAEACLLDGALELGKCSPGVIVIARLECALDACDLGKQARVLRQRRPKLNVQVGRSRTVHAGDLHVAAERNRPDSVLDPVARDLHQRRREAQVEPARPHTDRPRDEEVAGLVEEDQNRETKDGNEDAHATFSASSTWRRAASSAATSSSRSRAADPSTAANASSTTSAMPRNGSRPSRNAATATSLAALNAQG